MSAAATRWTRTTVVAMVVLACAAAFVAESYRIPSGSMEPTLQGDDGGFSGDRVLTLKGIDGFRPLRRGDVIVFFSPDPGEPLRRLIKRVVALPGETVEIVEGSLHVDGRAVEEPAIFRELRYGEEFKLAPGNSFTVPPGHWFVLGDNTQASRDSRMWGAVPADHVLGRAVCVWWPWRNRRFLTPAR